MRHSVVVLALLATACESFVATDGRVFALNANHSSVDPWPLALVASGEHDLGCPTAQVHVATGYNGVVGYNRGMVGIVEGCGVRATYNVIGGHLVLIAKLRLDDAK